MELHDMPRRSELGWRVKNEVCSERCSGGELVGPDICDDGPQVKTKA